MSRRTLKNLFDSIFPPTINHGFEEDLMGATKKVVTLAAETVVSLDFGEDKFIELALGSANITINAVVTGLKPGEQCYLKIIQDATGARTVAFGTNMVENLTVTASTDAIDLFMGIFDGTNIIFGPLAQDVS